MAEVGADLALCCTFMDDNTCHQDMLLVQRIAVRLSDCNDRQEQARFMSQEYPIDVKVNY